MEQEINNKKTPSKISKSKINKKSYLPILITRELFIFPGYSLEIDFARDISIQTIQVIFENYNGDCIIISQKDQEIDSPAVDDIYEYGVLAHISPIAENIMIHGSKKIMIKGISRTQISKEDISIKNGIFYSTYKLPKEEPSSLVDKKSLLNQIITLLDEQIITKNLIPSNFMSSSDAYDNDKNISLICDGIAHYLPISSKIKQQILKDSNVKRRLEILIDELKRQKSSKDIEKRISKKIRSKIDETQKEYLLREKLKVIKEELGELSGKDTDINEIRNKVQTEPYPENIKAKILEELKKYEIIPQASAESNVIYSYIDWLIKLPWWQVRKESKDLDKVWKILESNHYGLKKLKERIVEYIAVKIQLEKTNKTGFGDIICLVGPPGVGKHHWLNQLLNLLIVNFLKYH
ncbi:LON peptidase substrate-binding domain-containing protein [Mycoplasma sp. SG1]|uniref:LON peptidase substrate-binding domain-containing protein n=1 Tax=Mycoplasma sp. SG1 TaxID=2810348 RepID=UPI002023D437|nr:LON peptidase substrate-binding domain-containing protein [Mycoplasma sp. SG1]URM52771.1 LON peptidase substrate-binding domain-containing protein [Mycoplasma sp. SG1]